MKTKMVALKDLKLNLFVRECLNQDHALHLAALLENGVKLPPIKVNPDLIVIDGRHRIEAHDVLSRKQIEVEVVDITDETKLIAEAYKANIGGSLLPTKEDTEHTVTLLVERGESIRTIAEMLALPPGITRSYVAGVKSIIARRNLQRAAESVTNGVHTTIQAAEKYKVDLDTLKEKMDGRRHPPKHGVPELKRQISKLYRSTAQKNAGVFKGLLHKYQDAVITEQQVTVLIKHVEGLQDNQSRTLLKWKQRFEALINNGK